MTPDHACEKWCDKPQGIGSHLNAHSATPWARAPQGRLQRLARLALECGHGDDVVRAAWKQAQDAVVERHHRWPVRHADEGDVPISAGLHAANLGVHIQAACALIHNGERHLAVEESSKADALLFAEGQHVTPPSHGVGVKSLQQGAQASSVHRTQSAASLLLRTFPRARVDDLVDQRALDEVWPLRQEEDCLPGRTPQIAELRPHEAREEAQQRRLAGAAGADDDEAPAARRDFERQQGLLQRETKGVAK
mmetsp:Transcript_11856/g.33341  ORF Transcript_11856/g.33341 Transcript_11856/m.33341 type:complete len:251 (+) Transcript_11856:109-861(+)